MSSEAKQNTRAHSLDALRGYAILTMVLSATVAGGIPPGWMYHAQTPPPTHAFVPEMAGLTWVDLVFPFFLFAMGAAFPFSLRRKIEKNAVRDTRFWLSMTWQIVARAAMLTFFAIFIQHYYPYMQADTVGPKEWWMAILAFGLCFAMFMRFPKNWNLPKPVSCGIRVAAYGAAAAMLIFGDFAGGKAFDLNTSNIIILLLADMAFFGSIVYLATMTDKWRRMWVLVALAGLFLSSEVDGSWVQAVRWWTPLPWFYHFDYLKYLFLILAGSTAGDMLMDHMRSTSSADATKPTALPAILASGALLIVVTCLIGLYNRECFLTTAIEAALCVAMIAVARRTATADATLWRRLILFGTALLLTGLCFEAFEGGIKKDGPTFSYLLATGGLATFALVFFHIVCDYFGHRRATAFLWMNGQNPMIAYVAGDLLLMPLLSLLGLVKYLSVFHTSAWMGFLQGVLLTAAVMLITMLFTRLRIFWRT